MAGTFVSLTLDEAEDYVSNTLGAYWQGWDIMVWRENPSGWSKSDGGFNRDMPSGRGWGILHKISPDSNGRWRVRNESGRLTRSR